MLRLPAVVTLLVLLCCASGRLGAQAQPAPQPLKISKVKDDLYVVTGDAGNTTVYVTPEGVILVDDKFARNFDDLMTAIRSVTDKPIKYVFNTHAHGDHTGGNEKLISSATIIGHVNARKAMIDGKQPGPPQITYKDQITVNLGGKEVAGYYFGRAHTNGDTWVYFPALRVLASGDSFNNGTGDGGTGGYFGMFIAYPTGGSIIDMTKTLDEALKLDFDTVIPGHGPLATRAEVVKWRAEVETVRNRIRGMLQEGKNKEQITKMLVDEFRWDPNGIIIQRSVDGLMNELRP